MLISLAHYEAAIPMVRRSITRWQRELAPLWWWTRDPRKWVHHCYQIFDTRCDFWWYMQSVHISTMTHCQIDSRRKFKLMKDDSCALR